MKKLIMLVMVLGIVFGSYMDIEPVFRGNEFGIGYNQLKEEGSFIKKDVSDQGVETYIYRATVYGEVLTVLYGFYKGKLYIGSYYTDDFNKFDKLNDQIVATYGGAHESNRDSYSLSWYSKDMKTILFVAFDTSDFSANLYVADVKTIEAIYEEEQKALRRRL